jgi:hypothetical protein
MKFQSYTREDLEENLAENPILKIWELTTPSGREDDVLLGESRKEVMFDLSNHHGWGEVEEVDGEYVSPSTVDFTYWKMQPNGLPVEWKLREVELEEIARELED